MKTKIIKFTFAALVAITCMAGEPKDKPDNGIVVSGELRAIQLMKVRSVEVFPGNRTTLEELFKDLGGFTEWSARFTIIKKDGTEIYFHYLDYKKDSSIRTMELNDVKSVKVRMQH
ncbi:hypothetical protein P3T73_06980 [Kiritimatiellota bacterium B12222]|nr:hypothetical protein P3T73_10110 [Kiritimatiellota bacterium B12222]WFB37501.1 hypothetical protein P3T73_06980 [Kiritimatiellota bacterium B12222]